jgi:hypothetical protein
MLAAATAALRTVAAKPELCDGDKENCASS